MFQKLFGGRASSGKVRKEGETKGEGGRNRRERGRKGSYAPPEREVWLYLCRPTVWYFCMRMQSRTL